MSSDDFNQDIERGNTTAARALNSTSVSDDQISRDTDDLVTKMNHHDDKFQKHKSSFVKSNKSGKVMEIYRQASEFSCSSKSSLHRFPSDSSFLVGDACERTETSKYGDLDGIEERSSKEVGSLAGFATLPRKISRVTSQLVFRQHATINHDPNFVEEFQNSEVGVTKLFFVLVLVVAASVSSTIVWHIVSSEERRSFESSFETFSFDLLEGFAHRLDMMVWTGFLVEGMYETRFGCIDHHALKNQSQNHNYYKFFSKTSTTENCTSTFPNVTLENFNTQVTTAVALAHLENLYMAPRVSVADRVTFESYAKSAEAWELQEFDHLNEENQDYLSEILDMGIQCISNQMLARNDANIAYNCGEQMTSSNADKSFNHIIENDYWPVWQTTNPPNNILRDLRNDPRRREGLARMLDTNVPVFTSVALGPEREPNGEVLIPIFRDGHNISGTISLSFKVCVMLSHLLPHSLEKLHVEIVMYEFSYSFIIDKGSCSFEGGNGTVHHSFSKSSFLSYKIPNHPRNGGKNNSDFMHHHSVIGDEKGYVATDAESMFLIKVHPTKSFENQYRSSKPAVYAFGIAFIYLITSASFLLYDYISSKHQKSVERQAAQSTNIVNSLFPVSVRDRLFQDHNNNRTVESKSNHSSVMEASRHNVKMFLNGNSKNSREDTVSATSSEKSTPIADLFLNTSVIFADITNFTAWSSERDPDQVFVLLETVYKEFDSLASKYNVFKIETIGDCYVAVTGLPDPNARHAEFMVKFAHHCVRVFNNVIEELELTLGPGTANLGLRVGIHSGPVTGGVIRGDKSRFQLFGDTMNTASRMESSGKKNMIHISPDTYQLLVDVGKGYWAVARESRIALKGKGSMQTYWIRSRLNLDKGKSSSWRHLDVGEGSQLTNGSSNHICNSQCDHNKTDRLILWNTTVLEKLLISLVASRDLSSTMTAKVKRRMSSSKMDNVIFNSIEEVMSEIAKPILFSRYNSSHAQTFKQRQDDFDEKSHPQLQKAKVELFEYVSRVASNYNRVHFHNFEHASHVTMSANKLMKKVRYSNWTSHSKSQNDNISVTANIYFKTFGIGLDPLAQFSVVFAALVHDVSHRGISNDQIIKEDPFFASMYNNLSVAELHSIRVAWNLLMEDEFENLRACIFVDANEKDRFRKLLLHIIMATDIADTSRVKFERVRWDKAFTDVEEWKNKCIEVLERNKASEIDVSLKGTAVLEQLMLASDIAHTMQHWFTYIKWNTKLFKERYAAFLNGRGGDVDPLTGWYDGEIGFFNGYIIPLATRLRDSGIFGSAGDEYLGHALANKEEWKNKGKDIVEEYRAIAKEMAFELQQNKDNNNI